jgi:hypothetical protein
MSLSKFEISNPGLLAGAACAGVETGAEAGFGLTYSK